MPRNCLAHQCILLCSASGRGLSLHNYLPHPPLLNACSLLERVSNLSSFTSDMADCPPEKSLNRRHHSESGLRSRATRAAVNGGGVNLLISDQLSLELDLQDKCRELLCLYKESQDWPAVGQLAQTLVTSSSRSSDLKRRLQDQEQLPYLEKIPESGQPQLNEDPTSLEDIAADGGECLCKSANGSQDSVNKQEVLKSSDLFAAGEHSVGCAAGADDLGVPEGLKCEGALEKNSGSVEVSKGVGFAISSNLPFISTSDHINLVTAEGVKESNLDELEDQMEQLANQFTDLSEQYDYEAEQACDVPVATTLVTDNNDTRLEVPEQLKTTYASSDSSDQFFSPRNSLYDEGSCEVAADADLFEDAMSGSEEAMDSTLSEPSWGCDEGEIVFSVEKVSEDLVESGHVNDIYSIKGAPSRDPVLHSYHEFIQLQEQLASSVGSGSALVLESEGRGRNASTELETFLNRAASLPGVREMDYFVNFLRHGGASLSNHYGMFMTGIIARVRKLPCLESQLHSERFPKVC